MTTLAGLAGTFGGANGTGSVARFNNPMGVAVDNTGNVYVADGNNQTIRQVSPAGVVTTLAGLAQVDQSGNPVSGSANGTRGTARFNSPFALAVGAAGDLYVADTGNNTIRKVTPAGVVTTFAGLAGSAGNVNGSGSTARFNQPFGMAADSTGNLYVADAGNNTIRKVTPTGVVTTLGGLPQFDQFGNPALGSANEGSGSTARFNSPRGIAVDSAGIVYVADSYNNTIRVGTTNTCPDQPTIESPWPLGPCSQPA